MTQLLGANFMLNENSIDADFLVYRTNFVFICISFISIQEPNILPGVIIIEDNEEISVRPTN